MTFSKNLHTIHEGLPFKTKAAANKYDFQPKIADDMPIGDQEKTRRERRIQLMTNEAILKANVTRPGTIKSNR